LAQVGFAALIDEATGHQYARPPDALQVLLQDSLPEGWTWQQLLDDEFYLEAFDLGLHRANETFFLRFRDMPEMARHLAVAFCLMRLADNKNEAVEMLHIAFRGPEVTG